MNILVISTILLSAEQAIGRDTQSNDQVLLLTGTVPGTGFPGIQWGDLNRDADHATVAVNSERDICVAYHTDRNGDLAGTPDLKQVEIALFRYNGGVPETWTRVQSELLGYVKPDVLQLGQTFIKCERPDVAAIGNRFFVVWTRRYDRNTVKEEPAVLEAAWIEWDANQSKFIVYNSGNIGEGFLLDRDDWNHDNDNTTANTRFFVRECAGVPDAVVLSENIAGVATVGVVYPHQYDFGDIIPIDDTRFCDLRFVTCSFDGINVTRGVPQVLKGAIPFDGVADTAGFVLPEVARGSVDGRFILAYEEQQYVMPGGPTFYGMIRVRMCQYDFNNSHASEFASHTFGSSSNPISRRRPNLSSRPVLGSGVDQFSIAFNKLSPTGDIDVVYEEWACSETGFSRLSWPYSEAWPNSPNLNDFRPAPLHGTTTPFFRRCYAESPSPGGGCDIREYSVDDNPLNNVPFVLATVNAPNGRPATSYWYESGAPNPHYAVVTWEGPGFDQTGLKIWIRIRK